MRITNLARLLNGILLNNPSISQISGFSFDAKSTKRQNAFICLIADDTEIELAIKNGAYAIISSENLQIKDKEIAYIKVSNMQGSLFRLMRFLANEKKLRFYYVNLIQMSILKQINLKNASLIKNEIKEIFESIENAEHESLFFADKRHILEHLSPNYEYVLTDTNAISINPSSIFFTNTICDDIYYQNLNIPQVFLSSFCGIIKFLNKNGIKFRLNEIKNLGHFEPIFIDKNFRAVSFGSSFRAIIAESDKELFMLEAKYLAKTFDDKDFIVALPKDTDFDIPNSYKFNDISEIKNLINFRYMLVFSQKDRLLNLLNETSDENLLF